MNRYKFFLIICMAASLAACQPPVATAPPTPLIVRVQYTPALAAWTQAMNRCMANIADSGLVVNEVPAGSLDPSQVDFVLRFGPLDPQPNPISTLTPVAATGAPLHTLSSPTNRAYYQAVIARDEIVLVVNPTNAVTGLTPAEVSAIYSGQMTQWSGLSAGTQTPVATVAQQQIQAWTYLQGDDLRSVFDEAFLQGGAAGREVYQAPDPAAMLQAIANNPGAIGFLLKSQLSAAVRQIPLDGEPDFELTQPIVAISLSEPQGQARQLLVCLQGK